MIDKIIDTFREESYELLSQLEQLLLDLESSPEDKEIISAVFRVMHTIKGSAAMFGFEQISSLAHEVEFVLDSLREGKISVSKELIDLTLAARDLLRALLDTGEQNAKEFSRDVESLVEKSRLLLPSKEPTEKKEVKQEEKRTASDSENTYRIRFTPHSEIFLQGTRPLLLLKELTDSGEYSCIGFTEKIPPLSELDPEKCYVSWEIILTTGLDSNAVHDIFIFVESNSTVKIATITDFSNLLSNIEDKRLGEILIDKGVIKKETLESALKEQKKIGEVLLEGKLVTSQELKAALEEQQHARKLKEKRENLISASSIRVNSEKLDDLVDLVGELVTIQARLSQTSLTLGDSALTSLSEQIESLTAELRDISMGMRMLPIGSTFNKFNRLVRDLSAGLGKEVVMITEGAETELDKTVIERLNDPLVHLIRNCIDHGLEMPEERAKAGKPKKGTVTLSAVHSGGTVHITIADDGAGLDVNRIKEKALSKGLISAEDNLTDSQIHQLIFAPGFSTAVNVTSVSGRGVGMDVVKKEIEALRGSVNVSSKSGAGTKVTLSLPLTLAIIEGLLTKIGEDHYVIPLSSVEECVELIESEDKKDVGKSIINVRGQALPFVRVKNIFGIKTPAPPIEQIVIVRTRDQRIGIVVDQVIGDYQTVIKSLGSFYKEAEGISGATILGDGSVALILDINRVAELVKREEDKVHGRRR